MAYEGPLDPLDGHDPGTVGPYALLGRLGAGSMGRVYLGRSASGRLAAVKTVRAELAREPDFRARFGLEVAAARRVSGVYTAAVVDADAGADVPWLATAYVPAPSLERLVGASGPLPLAAVRWLAAGCAEALESIHAAGLVHRDLKPSNVLVSLDGPRVIDFGLAHAAERARVTLSRVAVGTPAFMAPEQAQGPRGVSAASDVYALGAVLLFAATGHGPYAGEGVLELMAQLATRAPDLAGLPVELSRLVQRCLERDPARRPRPGEVLAAVSPHLGLDPGVPYLSGTALDLVREFGEGPRIPVPVPVPVPDPRPAAPVPVRSRGGESTREPSSSSSARAFLAEPRTRVASVLAIGLICVGALLGRSFWPAGGPARPAEAAPGPEGRPPPGPGGDPPAPRDGAGERPTGNPRIMVNQDEGDGDTVFVVHGSGWSPGERVTVWLDRFADRPGPVADRRGTFNYAVNQTHEFTAGPLPPGPHIFFVSAPSRRDAATTMFRVVP
ncbi:serine/threonine-protein kinase [Actinomadura roseirufa]|uniref:serine/threonine-protein kinase n=1 Tax=Actinomadura roseirufa TaxID=2094049 RepID=UPI001A954728|nr:serine/threonine-protein kinase [Actinomadura roseirufa]